MSGSERFATVACVAALALVVGGCGGSTPPSPTVTAATGEWCTASPDRAWRQWLGGPAVALSTTASVTPWALAGDGRSFFASIVSSDYSGVVRIDATTGTYVRIRPFRDARQFQAVGGFDGRFLAFREYHRLNDGLADFTVHAWDAQTGVSWQIGAAAPDGHGGFFPSPWRDISVRDGFATWTTGTGDDGSGAVHVYDLARRADRVVRRGHPAGSALLDGGIVVWPESPGPGEAALMRAATVAGDPVAVPAAFAGRGLMDGFATDGRAVALPTDDWRRLSWTADATAPRETVLTAPTDEVIANGLSVAGSLVGFGIDPTVFLADASVGRAVALPDVSYTLVDDQSVLVLSRAVGKALHPIQPVRLLARRSMPTMPACG
jgi:hypothetical protein